MIPFDRDALEWKEAVGTRRKGRVAIMQPANSQLDGGPKSAEVLGPVDVYSASGNRIDLQIRLAIHGPFFLVARPVSVGLESGLPIQKERIKCASSA